MEKIGPVWQLQFTNGTTATEDLVIGSDGHWSKIRPYLTGIGALYSGATIIQGEIEDPQTQCPEIYALVNQGNLIAMGDGKTLAAQPRGDGGLTFYAASLYPENWIQTSGIDFDDREQVNDYLVQHYAGWNPVLLTVFKVCNQFVPRPLNYFPLDQNWTTRPDITLIGDAAHLTPPSGEGVNTAMLDALDLSEYLMDAGSLTLEEAIAAYENHMRSRAVVLGQEAVDGIKDFAAPSDESIGKLVEMLA